MERSAAAAALALAASAAALLVSGEAAAAPRWVDRGITLPRLVFAGDAGIGVAHLGRRGPFSDDITGVGLNVEGALGVTNSLELGLRTGIRLGNDARLLGADQWGRTLWTETYGTGSDTVANPEFKIRWAMYSGPVVEVGLDGRVFTPIERGTRFGVMFGVPLTFHAGSILRIDTGVYVPVVFNDDVSTVVSVPAYFWFQVSNAVWLGPMLALRHVDPAPLSARNDLLVGFGLGYQVASAVDLKWMVFAPRINDDDFRTFGIGFGVQFRIGE